MDGEKKKILRRTKQCEKCPWKVATNPHEIPYGYSEELHKRLANTIADESGNLTRVGKSCNVMACHHSKSGDEDYCVGWLNHQLGVGNNIPLRIEMMRYANAKDIEVFGEQHRRFEDTLPESKQMWDDILEEHKEYSNPPSDMDICFVGGSHC